MTETGPIRIITNAGDEISPSCPICKSTDKWHRIAEPQPDKGGSFKAALIAVAENGSLMGMPVSMFACTNCGYVFHQLIPTEGESNDVSE